MAGGNAHKPPPSSSSAGQSHHQKSRWESSSSAAATDHKPSGSASNSMAESKPKASPNSSKTTTTITTPNKSKVANNKPPTPKPKPRSEIPLRPENPNAHLGSHPVFPFPDPPPPPAYGFHMLDRRTIILADGSVRSYLALPPDYTNFTPMPRPGFRPEFRGPPEFGLDRPHFPMSPDFLPEFRPEFRGPDDPFGRARNQECWNSMGPGPESSMKRKFGEEERKGNDAFDNRQPQHALKYRNASTNANANGPGPGPGPSGLYNLGSGEEMRPTKYMKTGDVNLGKLKHNDVDQNSLRKAFSHFVKLIYENANQKRTYLADGKQGSLQCLACRRTPKHFPDMHGLIMHTYHSDSGELLVDHLGFHKALCILMGWNYLMPPENSKAYQMLSADDAVANQDDLIMWPPSVLIHNTLTGKGRDGRMEGIGNRPMDSILRDLGFSSCKSMSLFSREGHLGIHVVKFPSDASGLKEALRLAEHFEKQNRGRKDWVRVQSSSTFNKEDDNNPNLVKLDVTTGEKMRIFYGHLATVSDLDKVTFEIKKKVTIESRRDYNKHS